MQGRVLPVVGQVRAGGGGGIEGAGRLRGGCEGSGGEDEGGGGKSGRQPGERVVDIFGS